MKEQGLDILVTTTKPNWAHKDLLIIHTTQLPPKQHFRETCRTLWIDQTWCFHIPLNTHTQACTHACTPEEVGFEVCDPFSRRHTISACPSLSSMKSFGLIQSQNYTFLWCCLVSERFTLKIFMLHKSNQDNTTRFKIVMHDGLQRCFCSTIKEF